MEAIATHLVWVATASGLLRLVCLLSVPVLCRTAARYGVDIEIKPLTSYLRITGRTAATPHGGRCTGCEATCLTEEPPDHGTTGCAAERPSGQVRRSDTRDGS